ncbi:MAG: hypothetical protein JNM51_06930 [Bacteroidia bacterium]|nr:hypothetical protein [Bacteroidia bacterium]
MNKLIKFSRSISISFLLLTGINAIIAGLLFIIDPSGKKMGMSTSYLSHSPFSTFLITGITLFLVNGLLNIITAITTINKYKHYPVLILLQGLFLAGWIIVQVIWVKDFNALHLTMLSIGIVLIANGIILKRELNVFL